MKSRMKMTSTMLLIALVFSLVPAMTLPTGASAASCDWAQFITDVTVPDGAKYEPGATFKKTWRLKNIGTCTWDNILLAGFRLWRTNECPGIHQIPIECCSRPDH